MTVSDWFQSLGIIAKLYRLRNEPHWSAAYKLFSELRHVRVAELNREQMARLREIKDALVDATHN